MNKTITILLLFIAASGFAQQPNRYVSRQGQVEFFSYTKVENIKAINNQAQSVFDITTSEIGVRMLMRAFVFKKALMQEHFNESYIESDIYPKCSFEGKIMDLERPLPEVQTKLIKGNVTIHGVSKELEIKAKIENNQDKVSFSGTFNLQVSDFKIKIPPIVAGNISKTIEVNFRFEEYLPYEN